MSTFDPLKTAYSRVFLIEGRARPDRSPSYEAALRMMGVDQGLGDIERIENPDPSNYGRFIEIGEVRGATERPTTSLQGKYAANLKSTLMRLAREGCAVDLQLHIGACSDPRDFDTFQKAIIFESASLTSYGTDELGALASGDNSPVNETADISAKEMYEIVPISYGVKAASVVTNEVVAVTICDSVSCGECEDESDGCQKIYAVSKAAGGSPSTPPDVVFSLDKGQTWYAHDIDSLGAAEDPSDVFCLGDYLVVISYTSGSLHYAPKSDINTYEDPAWAEVATGFVVGGEPRAAWAIDGMAFIVGEDGYVYKCEDPTSGVEVLDAGSATTVQLNDVHAISSEFAVAVGNNGKIIFTENGTTWSTPPSAPVGWGVNILCVWVVSETVWWVGTSTGSLYYTLNAGSTWTECAFYGSGSGTVLDIFFSTDSIGWVAHQTSGTKGRILRTYNAGKTWKVTPEGTAALTANDKINKLAGCSEDANFIVGVGLADDASDGFIVVGLGA